ncbi:hypothetical protein DUI87_15774 [Hirundo rustica rustica]|uniref:ribonuclease H n=3 Tax=Neoaves TaxID=3078114 RepID=A0A3M0JZG2_HIRRU|nr:hypothetical protein DUI87_15774 [Hirundo rustica rustica]
MYHRGEPIVNFEVGPQHEEYEFLVDTGADRSSIRKLPVGVKVGTRTCEVVGAEGKPFTASIIEGIEVKGNSKQIRADFIYLPDLESNLLGRDLQVLLGIGVIPEGGQMKVKIMKLTAGDIEEINPEVWAEGGKSGLLNIPPIEVKMQPGTPPIRIKQYPMSLEGKKGLIPIIEQLLKEGILEPCMSPHNTPILAVKKAEGKYRLVQDLREINKRTITKHPVVPNPYNLLSQIPQEHAWFTTIDLKDAFWACPLAEESRDWFAFEWDHPETKRRQQLRWTRLPQGFTESPNLFGQALERLLEQFTPEGQVQILQHWIDEYTQNVRFLYDKLVSPEPIEWTQEDEKQLEKLKNKLSTAPVLSLPDLKKEFDLFVNTEGGVAYGVLAQEWGGCKKPIAFLSKILDPVARGWPACLQAVAATAVLVEESQKLTLNGKIQIHTPHDIKTVLSQKAPGWVTDSRILKYEITLINSENLRLTVSKNLNPAQFLSGEPPPDLEHDCLELMSLQTKVREDLESTPLPYGKRLFTDGSSRVLEGKRVSGYAVVEGSTIEDIQVRETGKLPSSWSAQLCEIYAVKRGLDLLGGDRGTIYTDSKYAFGIVHTFGKIWEERGYLNSKGKDLVHKEMIRSVLTSLLKPIEIAVVHVKGHQKETTFEGKGNQLADKEAKRAAQDPKGSIRILALNETSEEEGGEEKPKYDRTELKAIKDLGMRKGEHGEWLTPDGRKFLNKPLARRILTEIHELTHWGTQGLCDHFLKENFCIGIYSIAKAITQGCTICQKVNQRIARKAIPGGRELALRPFQSIQIDFTEMPQIQGYKHLLVMVDHLTHWIEAFPTKKETAEVVAGQLTSCQEEGKKYWVAKNIANYRQRLTGECPMREWFCLEKIDNQEGASDLVKEKPLTIRKDELSELPNENLFIDLIERISHELNLTNCWICGSTQVADVWPWEGISLSPLDILKWKMMKPEPPYIGEREIEQWDLKTKVVGEECIKRTGKRYKTPVGRMACKRTLIIRDFIQKWIPREPYTYWATRKTGTGCIYNEVYDLYQCTDRGINPFWGIEEISKYWESPFITQNTFWNAPEHLFWICGDKAYTHLPRDWAGSCTIGIIKPAFFLLPRQSGNTLGVPLYDNLKRQKRTVINMGSSQDWKGEVWTPEKIIQTYGPATWAQDGSWGYRTPVYMLNRIIRLQAVLEVISNNTALALDHISQQLFQTRTVVYQIRLAVDYLLADEGGICGKFNTSECCLEIDDKSEVIRNISKEIRRVAYVGNQEWTPLLNIDWWDRFWSSKGAWWKKNLGKQEDMILLIAYKGNSGHKQQ